MNPQIDYKHILSELSINRKDSCEVIRELISNSYDASANNMYYLPLLQYNGFIFADDGIGLDTKKEIKGITPYLAFFSIGRSTKIEGSGIGYKCQGSKFCFACSTFALITKTKDDTNWHYKIIQNPQQQLTNSSDVSPEITVEPWAILRNMMSNAKVETEKILSKLDKSFFDQFSQGTFIVVLDFQTTNFAQFFNTENLFDTYFYNYIKLYTKHGDVRILKKEQAFDADKINSFSKLNGVKKDVIFQIWIAVDSTFKHIPAGFPYLTNDDNELIKSPIEVAQLKDSRFYARYAKTVKIDGLDYSFVLAIDGYRRALDKYKSLGRQRQQNSGIKLSDQRGIIICSQGIKICSYNDILTEPALERYEILQDAKSQIHYTFFIDGSFALVTNRNSLSEQSIKTLKSSNFLNAILSFLKECEEKKNSLIFKQLIGRLKKENHGLELTKQTESLTILKQGISKRERFNFVKDDFASRIFGPKSFVVPESGEEHWVGALYNAQ